MTRGWVQSLDIMVKKCIKYYIQNISYAVFGKKKILVPMHRHHKRVERHANEVQAFSNEQTYICKIC